MIGGCGAMPEKTMELAFPIVGLTTETEAPVSSEKAKRGNAEQTPQPTPLSVSRGKSQTNVVRKRRYSTTSRAHNEPQLPRLAKDLMMTTQLCAELSPLCLTRERCAATSRRTPNNGDGKD
jgi:hypothetical protein